MFRLDKRFSVEKGRGGIKKGRAALSGRRFLKSVFIFLSY
jgi:hypothetical protein